MPEIGSSVIASAEDLAAAREVTLAQLQLLIDTGKVSIAPAPELPASEVVRYAEEVRKLLERVAFLVGKLGLPSAQKLIELVTELEKLIVAGGK